MRTDQDPSASGPAAPDRTQAGARVPGSDAGAPGSAAMPLRKPRGWRCRAAPILALLLLGGCTGEVVGLRLPGGPTRGSMTHDEAMGARSGLTSVDRLPPAERR